MAGQGEDDVRPKGAPEHAESDDELERRLRDMHWPEPPPGVRERALADFQHRIAKLRGEDRLAPDSE
jgi:hypothetical protein